MLYKLISVVMVKKERNFPQPIRAASETSEGKLSVHIRKQSLWGVGGQQGVSAVYARRGQLKFIMSGNRSGACTHLGTRVPARYYD